MLWRHLPSTASTNDEARRLTADTWVDPSPVPILVSADEQTAGRGRMGRAWHSPQGGAWFSLAWPWRGTDDRLTALPLVAGLAVRRALLSLCPVPGEALRIKWPNDLLLHDGKVAGVLCEQDLDDHTPRAVIVGVGINVQPAAEDLRLHAGLHATSLAQHLDHVPPITDVIDRCAEHLVSHLQAYEENGLDPDSIDAIQDRLAWLGQRVSCTLNGKTLTQGNVLGIDESGRLRLKTSDGVEAVSSGELSLRPA